MIDQQLAERCVSLLRELIVLDTEAMTLLFKTRVKCNKDLANHPTVQVTQDDEVGILGILNGLCGVYEDGPSKGSGAVAVILDEDGTVIDAKILSNQDLRSNIGINDG